MFHQICLLPADKPVLHFIWWDMKRTDDPKIYEWQVLPFDTTCSPCCGIYALQRHVQYTSESNSHLVDCVEQSFYVDNCLCSTHSKEEARDLDGLHQLLHTGALRSASGLVMFRQSSNIFLPMSEAKAVRCGFPILAWTFRSQLLGYNGTVPVTP